MTLTDKLLMIIARMFLFALEARFLGVGEKCTRDTLKSFGEVLDSLHYS